MTLQAPRTADMHPRIAEIRQQQEAREQVRALLYAVGGIAAVEAWEKAKSEGQEEGKKQAARRQNTNFVQVSPVGWDRLDSLIQQDKNAARLYAFLCKHMGNDGTVAASRRTLAEAMETTERTISRHVAALEKLGALVVLKIGTANVYCLNPEEVWRSFNNAKPYAAFYTKTLVGKKENPFVKRRLTTLLNGREPEQKDLFADDSGVEWPAADPETDAEGFIPEDMTGPV